MRKNTDLQEKILDVIKEKGSLKTYEIVKEIYNTTTAVEALKYSGRVHYSLGVLVKKGLIKNSKIKDIRYTTVYSI